MAYFSSVAVYQHDANGKKLFENAAEYGISGVDETKNFFFVTVYEKKVAGITSQFIILFKVTRDENGRLPDIYYDLSFETGWAFTTPPGIPTCDDCSSTYNKMLSFTFLVL